MADASARRAGTNKHNFSPSMASAYWPSISADTVRPSPEQRPQTKKATPTSWPPFDTCTPLAPGPFPLWARAWAETRLPTRRSRHAPERSSVSYSWVPTEAPRPNAYSSDGPRLPRISEHYGRAPEPKKLVVLEGSAHAQFIFDTDQGPRLIQELLRFLSEP
jgi:hypothetical protein